METRFTDNLVRSNNLSREGFRGWVFDPAMLFQGVDKWWGDYGRRENPHEGLDICLFRGRGNSVLALNEETVVPATHDGKVVKMLDDFLGRSIVLLHEIEGPDDSRLCTFYGHTVPIPQLSVGTPVRRGDLIASIAGVDRSPPRPMAHLHLSFAWVSRSAEWDGIDWVTIGSTETVTLLDPSGFIDGRFQVERRFGSG